MLVIVLLIFGPKRLPGSAAARRGHARVQGLDHGKVDDDDDDDDADDQPPQADAALGRPEDEPDAPARPSARAPCASARAP